MRSAAAERLVEDDESRTIGLPGQVVSVASKDNIDLVNLGLIAEGGMGAVMLARQKSLLRDVAIKTTKAGASPHEVDALVREALITGALEHPSIVPVHALGTDDAGRPLLVMKRVEGVSWLTLLRDPTHPAWKSHLGVEGDTLGANLDVLVHICRAIELAHQRGIIHRDIKPSNVMLGRFGEVYLVDWGIAAPTGTASEGVVGTPAYMAPEMVANEIVDERTDIYLLGATLHRVLTGETRHPGCSLEESLVAASVSAPYHYDASVPGALIELCNAACSAKKSDRPQSAAAFREALVAFQRRRGPTAICKVASERLARLERLLSCPVQPSELALAYRLATEARFGFAESLAQCPDLEEARIGQAKTIEALVSLELQQEHVDTAEALLEEATRESVARLRPRLDAARKAFAEKGAEQMRLRALAIDHDPTVNSRSRSLVIGALLFVQSCLALLGHFPWAPTQSVLGLALISCFVLAGTAGWVVIDRKRLLATQFGRGVIGLIVLCELVISANRLLGIIREQDVVQVASSDLLLLAALFASGALILIPRLAYSVPPLLLGLAITTVAPSWSHVVVPWTYMSTVVLGVWAVQRHSRALKRRSA